MLPAAGSGAAVGVILIASYPNGNDFIHIKGRDPKNLKADFCRGTKTVFIHQTKNIPIKSISHLPGQSWLVATLSPFFTLNSWQNKLKLTLKVNLLKNKSKKEKKRQS
jgi:hypothetical protein